MSRKLSFWIADVTASLSWALVSIWCPVCRVPYRFAGILETIENPAIPRQKRGLRRKSRCLYILQKVARKNSAYRSGCHNIVTFSSRNPELPKNEAVVRHYPSPRHALCYSRTPTTFCSVRLCSGREHSEQQSCTRLQDYPSGRMQLPRSPSLLAVRALQLPPGRQLVS